MKLIVTSSPHARDGQNIPNIMKHVIIALLPATFASVYFFGIPALSIILTSVISAMAFEAIVNILKKEPYTIKDGSAALTGLLLALTLPPIMPLWMVIVGNLVAIGLAKHAFGGLGHNIFNPALTGRLFLMVSYPVVLTTWQKAGRLFTLIPQTTATPLSTEGAVTAVSNLSLLIGNVAGSLGETSGIALLLGAAWLFYKKILSWKLPGIFFGTITIFALLLGQDPIFHILAGGALLGGFFMITDYVTSPVSKGGRIVYSLLTGIMVMSIRIWNNIPEGVAFSIVFMNALVPTIDRLSMSLHLKMYNKKFIRQEEKYEKNA